MYYCRLHGLQLVSERVYKVATKYEAQTAKFRWTCAL